MLEVTRSNDLALPQKMRLHTIARDMRSAVVSVPDNKQVFVWCLVQNRELLDVSHAYSMFCVALSHDSIFAATWSPTQCKVFDVETQKAIVCNHRMGVPVFFSGDNSLLAAHHRYEYVQVWEWRTGVQKYAVDLGESVIGMTLSDDCGALAARCSDHEVRVWGLKAGTSCTLATDPKRRDCVRVAFSADAKYLAFGGVEGTAFICDTSTNARETMAQFNCGVFTISFSPDSRLVASTSAMGTVVIWSTVLKQKLYQEMMTPWTLRRHVVMGDREVLTRKEVSSYTFQTHWKVSRFELRDSACARVLAVMAAPRRAAVCRCLLGDNSVMVKVVGWLRVL